MKFNKDMLIADIIKADPRVLKVFEKYGMNCGTCNAIFNEKMEIASRANGVNIDELLEELNNLYNR